MARELVAKIMIRNNTRTVTAPKITIKQAAAAYDRGARTYTEASKLNKTL